MSEHLYLEVKIGDIVHNPDKLQTKIFDGMLADYVYTPDWNISEFKPSNHTLKTFAICEVPVSWLPAVKEARKHNGDADDMDNDFTYRHTKGVIPLDVIAVKADDVDLESKLRGNDVVPIIDLRHLSEPSELIKDSRFIDLTKHHLDNNSISSGSYTVYLSGDYINYNSLIIDISGQDGDIDGLLMGNVTETGSVTYSGVSGYKLLFHSDTPHGGNRNAGHVVSINHTSFQYRINSNGELESKDFTVSRVQPASVDGRYGTFSNIGSNCTVRIHDMYMKMYTSVVSWGVGVRGQAANCKVYVYNCVVWYGAAGIYLDNNIHSLSHVSNVELVECHNNANPNNKTCTFRSIVCFDPHVANDFENPGSSDGYNNACSDSTGEDSDFATGSNNIVNLTAANEIETTESSDDFCKPKSGAYINAGGGTTHQSPTDMAGVAWGDNPSRGAFQSVHGGTNPERRCKLTIQGSKVVGTPSDMIIRLNKDNLPEELYKADSGYAAQSGGGDIRLATDEAGINFLPLHIRVFVTDNNPANAVVDMATKVTLTGSNQDIWIFYKTTDTDSQPASDAPGGSEGVY